MDDYVELLNNVRKYMLNETNPEVKDGEISVFELKQLLEKSFKELYKEKEAYNLLSKLNKEYTLVNKIKKFFKKKNNIQYENVLLSYDVKSTNIYFFGDKIKNGFGIKKDKNIDELYWDNKNINEDIKKFVNNNYSEIYDILVSLEEYRELVGIDFGSRESISFSDGFMNAVITYSTYGHVEIKTTIDKSIDPERISEKEYLTRERIQDVINNNEQQILKNIFVNTYNLDNCCMKLIRNKK